MSHNHPESRHCCSTASDELKLFEAFIFSIPIIFTFVLFLFYFCYLRRERIVWSSLRMRRFNGITESFSTPSQPGVEEFREMLPIIVFNESFSVKDTQCSVCLGNYQAEDKLQQIPACGHTFHMDCIDHWLATHTTCPLCRFSLIPSPKTAIDCSDVRVEVPTDDVQSYQESSRVGIEVGTPVQTEAESENTGEERGGGSSICAEEEVSDAKREVEECGCGGLVSDVVIKVETHCSIEEVHVTELP